jgi:acetyltransferase-like isoleucine patch superfamily enzyme
MFDFLALVTNKKYWILHSWIIKFILKCYDIKVGKNFYCEGVPKLKIRGKGSNIVIGNNVSFLGTVDLRNRENGKIIIGNNVGIDNDVRLLAANDAILSIGDFTGIGPYTVFNSGVDIKIGKYCLISGLCYFQSAEHGIQDNGQLISKQNHTYGNICIEDDVWISSNVTIAKNTLIKSGCVVGAKAFVRNSQFEEKSIIAGIPAKFIKFRS